MSTPLDGIKVVEIGVAMAAPFCGMVLGDYGAEVVKIERVGDGDDSRAWPPLFYGQLGHYFAAVNRNKRSIALDLKTPEGSDIARRLVGEADVVVQNYRVGALERAGLGYDEMSQLNERLVYCSISGFGREGPRREEGANDLFMQAFSGGMSVTGQEDGEPVKMGLSVADIGAGLFAAIGVLAALEERHRTGVGQHVAISLLDGQLAMLSYHLTAFFASGVVPRPQGSGTGFGVPYQAFPTADDWVVVAVFNETMWRSLCEGIERPDWIDDPRFCGMQERVNNRDVLIRALSDVLRSRSADHWVDVLEPLGVPCTRINRIDQIVEEPQVRDRGMIVDTDVADLGPVRMAGPPLRFGEAPPAITLAPPRLGEHSREILGELGLDADDVERLESAGVVGVHRASPNEPPS